MVGVTEAMEKTTLAGGGLMPSMTNSFVTSDCRKSGKLFFKKPIRHGCGDAFSSRSSRSQNSSGSTLVSISSCINVRTFRSTALGSRLDNSNKFAKNLRHFSLVLSVVWRCNSFQNNNKNYYSFLHVFLCISREKKSMNLKILSCWLNYFQDLNFNVANFKKYSNLAKTWK